jgi:hypothetical protein
VLGIGEGHRLLAHLLQRERRGRAAHGTRDVGDPSLARFDAEVLEGERAIDALLDLVVQSEHRPAFRGEPELLVPHATALAGPGTGHPLQTRELGARGDERFGRLRFLESRVSRHREERKEREGDATDSLEHDSLQVHEHPHASLALATICPCQLRARLLEPESDGSRK